MAFVIDSGFTLAIGGTVGTEIDGMSQAEFDIAKIIEGHVGYETPVQWRIASELAQHFGQLQSSENMNKSLAQMVNAIGYGIGQMPPVVTRARVKKLYAESMRQHDEDEAVPTPVSWWERSNVHGWTNRMKVSLGIALISVVLSISAVILTVASK